MPERSVILLVDDSDDDILLVQRAFRRGGVTNPLFVVNRGEEAIDYLRGEGKFGNRIEFPLPDLILLDLKMTGMDGFDVLRWLRSQPGLRAIRVIVLTSSSRIQDVNLAYSLGANSFLTKPLDFDNYIETCSALKNYWLDRDKMPEADRQPRRKPCNHHDEPEQ